VVKASGHLLCLDKTYDRGRIISALQVLAAMKTRKNNHWRN